MTRTLIMVITALALTACTAPYAQVAQAPPQIVQPPPPPPPPPPPVAMQPPAPAYVPMVQQGPRYHRRRYHSRRYYNVHRVPAPAHVRRLHRLHPRTQLQ
jgi:hypothetical protein